MQFRQVECEGKLALKPWFYCVAIGRDDVDGIGTGDGGNVHVEKLGDRLRAGFVTSPQTRGNCNEEK